MACKKKGGCTQKKKKIQLRTRKKKTGKRKRKNESVCDLNHSEFLEVVLHSLSARLV